MTDLPCNCYHSKEDHMQRQPGFYMWCRYSETGQCPCDFYTPMDNLEYLEHIDSIVTIEKLMKQKGI